MKFFLGVITIFILCTSILANDEIELIYKFTDGDNSVYKELQKSDISGSDGQETMDSKSEMEFETVIKVVKLSSDGGATLEYSSKPLKMTADGESLLNDEEDNKPIKIMVQMSKHGKVLSAESSDGEKLFGFLKDKQKPLLPEGKIKIGSKWDGMIPLDSLNCTIKCTLDEIYSEKGLDIAKISFTFEDKKDLKDTLADSGEDMSFFEEMNITGIKTNSGSGKIYFSINLGKIILIEYQSSGTSSISFDGNSTKTTDVSDYKFWRIK